MPTTQNTINLIRTKTSNSPQLEAIEGSLRKTGYIALLAFLSTAIVTGIVFSLFTLQLKNKKIEQAQLVTRVNELKTKEGYLLAIKDRTKTVEKAMANQKPWAEMMDLVNTFAVPPSLSGISVDEQNKIALTLKTSSLEDILKIVQTLSTYVNEGKIKNPQLVSFQFGKTGSFEISITFYALFDTT